MLLHMTSCPSILSTCPLSLWSKSDICGSAKQLHLQSGQICHWLRRPHWIFWMHVSDSTHGPCTHHSLFLAWQALSIPSASLPDGRLLSYFYFWCFRWQRTAEWQSINREFVLLGKKKKTKTALFLSILLPVQCLLFLFANPLYSPHEHYLLQLDKAGGSVQVLCNMSPRDMHAHVYICVDIKFT